MEMILNNPGFVHLAEHIFGNLDCEKLEVCMKINESTQQILENALFWIKRFKRLSKVNQEDWIKMIQSVKNTDKEKFIRCYLQWNLRKEALVDLPCYSNFAVQDEFRRRIRKSCRKEDSSDENTDIVKILAPLTDNPNAPDENGDTPIHGAASKGHTEIVKFLAPLTDDPNVSNNWGDTPRSVAQNDIIRAILVQFFL